MRTQSVIFLNQMYEEVQNLLENSCAYLKWQAPIEIRGMSSRESFKITHEAMRVAIRLSQIMTWMLIQKAAHKGEISYEECHCEEYQVLSGLACLERISETDPHIPPSLQRLLQDSRLLYERILRLHEFSQQSRLLSREIREEKNLKTI